MTVTDAERLFQEMARGAEVAKRHAEAELPMKSREDRLEVLGRFTSIKGGVFTLGFNGKNRVARLVVTRDGKRESLDVAAEVSGPAFPTEQFVAQCVLAVMSFIPANEVPDVSDRRARQIEERKRRDEYRDRQGQWRAIYDEK